MSTHPTPETLANIRAARTYQGVSPGEYLVTYSNIAQLLSKRTELTPENVYIIYYDDSGNRTQYTYAEFNARVNQAANFLSKELGVKRGDRVATIGHNHAELVIIYFACWKLGAAVAPQNIAEDNDRINYILRNSEAVVLFALQEYLDRIESIIQGQPPVEHIREVIEICPEPCGEYRHFQTEIAEQSPIFEAQQPVTLEDEALLVYTSGTTGSPKGVVLTQYNLLVDALGIGEWHGVNRDTNMMCVLPIHHVNGIIVTLVTPLLAGSTTILNQAYSSSQFWQHIAQENVQIVSVVPTLLQFSLEYAQQAEEEGRSIWGEDTTREDLSSFRHLICGAGTLSAALAAEFENKFQFPIIHGYGLSETTCYSCFLPLDLDWDTHQSWLTEYGYPSIGIPINTNEMTILDSGGSGEPLGPGKRGEICVRGHNVMKYYYRRSDANTAAFQYGWFQTGDEGFYEEDEHGRQFFFITGRIKELINRGGVKFSPFDIEEVLQEIPEINTGLAIAFENDYYGEEIGAYVVLRQGEEINVQEILAYCRQRLTFEKSPKVVVFGEAVPVTSTGKYQRLKLRDLFVEHKHTQFT